MPTPSATTLIKFLTEHLELAADDLVDLRDLIDDHLRKRVGVAPPTPRRTLYLPTDSLDDL